MKDWEIREAIIKADEKKKNKKLKFTATIECAFCGKEKVTHKKTTIYCSDKCRYLAWRKEELRIQQEYLKEIAALKNKIKELEAKLKFYEPSNLQ